MLLSIITVNYNDGSSLRNTVESVLRFKEANNIALEHLVVDGGSTDESLSLLKSFDLPHLRFVSEKDRGIYDAMNKGAKMAQGQFLIFVNSGDLLLNKKIHDLVPMLTRVSTDERLAGVSFDVKYNFKVFSLLIRSREVDLLSPKMPGIHQGILYKKEIFDTFTYSIEYKICGDYDHFSRILRSGLQISPVNETLSLLEAGGISTIKPYLLYKESIFITQKYFDLPSKNLLRLKFGLVKSLVLLVLIYKTSNLLYKIKKYVKW